MQNAAQSVTKNQCSFRANECLLKEGQAGDLAYLITGGKVAIRKGLLGDNPQTLAILGKGEVIGEMALFDGHSHVASAIALEETTALVMSRDDFQRRLAGMDPVMREILKTMIKRLRQMAEQSVPIAQEVNWADWKKK